MKTLLLSLFALILLTGCLSQGEKDSGDKSTLEELVLTCRDSEYTASFMGFEFKFTRTIDCSGDTADYESESLPAS